MAKKVSYKNKALPKSSTAKILKSIPCESGFHFYTALGNCTGITATSLGEFAAKLQAVPVESVDFHFQRKDFQKWIATAIGDKELAEGISIFGATRSSEDLRKEILRILQERIAELAGLNTINEGVMIRTAVPLTL